LDIPFFLSPIFFELTARVIPLRSGLRVFCFIGSALNNTGFPPIKQTLACDSKPPLSLSCPKENGAERKVKTKCLINHVQLIGFLGKDPEKRQLRGNGDTFTVLSVAPQQSWKDANDEWQSKTEWHRVVAFRRLGTAIADALHKGDHVLVDGMLVSSKYERENGKSKKAKAAKVTFWSVRANSVRRLSRAEAEPPTAPSGSDASDVAESGNAPY
jgi:single stranded DNA-binding protein